jgi:protein-arginine kinase activator protein McsA
MTREEMQELARLVVKYMFEEINSQAKDNDALLKDIIDKDDIIKEIERLQHLVLECEKTEEYEQAIHYMDKITALEQILKSKL